MTYYWNLQTTEITNDKHLKTNLVCRNTVHDASVASTSTSMSTIESISIISIILYLLKKNAKLKDEKYQ